MYISTKDWNNFISALSKLNQASADAIVKYVKKYGFGDTDALVGYAKGVIDLYGNASASLAAQMYDEISELEGKFYEPAELADTPDYGEVAKTVYGVLKTSENPNEMGGAVGRLVKRTGQDTLLQNGIRDGAEFAWIPNGDTCPFCLTLASRGWQRISKKALRNGHAEHIHSNCNCSYMIRHSDDVDVAGYEPEKYYEMYQKAEGKTPNEKINYMRRMQSQESKKNQIDYDLQFFAKKPKPKKVPRSNPLWDSLVQGDVEQQLRDGIFEWKFGEYEYLVEITERYDYNYLSKKKLKNIHEQDK